LPSHTQSGSYSNGALAAVGTRARCVSPPTSDLASGSAHSICSSLSPTSPPTERRKHTGRHARSAITTASPPPAVNGVSPTARPGSCHEASRKKNSSRRVNRAAATSAPPASVARPNQRNGGSTQSRPPLTSSPSPAPSPRPALKLWTSADDAQASHKCRSAPSAAAIPRTSHLRRSRTTAGKRSARGRDAVAPTHPTAGNRDVEAAWTPHATAPPWLALPREPL